MPRYLGRLVSHLQLLPFLGSTPRSAALPAVACCPLCSEDKLYLYDDTNLGGTWGHCRSCNFAGNMVDLAAAVWGLDVEAAVQRLSEHGFISEKVDSHFLEVHDKFYAARPRDLAALWAKVHKPPAPMVVSNGIQDTLRRLKIHYDWQPQGWRSGPGKLVGIAGCKEIERVLHPDQKHPDWGNRRIFTGRTVDAEALFVPFEDMPGRICALSIAWTGDSGQEEKIFARTLCFRHRNNQDLNAGLAFLSVALEAQKDRVYVLDDVWTALRLQALHLREASKPLPILACHYDQHNRTSLANRLLSSYGREIVFWSEKLNKDILRLAYQAGGLVATNDGVDDEISKHLGRYRPEIWLRRLDNLAVPWEKALAKYLQQVNDLEAEDTLAYLGMRHPAREKFYRNCPGEVRTRLQNSSCNGRSVFVGGQTIIEKDDAWYSAKDELLCGAVLRIDSVIPLPKSKKSFFRGRIIHGGKEFPYVVPTDTLVKNPFAWMHKQLLQEGVVLCHKPNFPNAMNVALQFNSPVAETGLEGCGWDEASSCFVAEKFSINARGEILGGRMVPFPERIKPTQGLKPPEDLFREDVEALSRQEEALSVVWATAACVLANIVAPALNRTTSGIACTNPGSFLVGARIAKSMGCAAYHQTQSDSAVACRAEHFEHTYNWPLVVLRHRQQAPSILHHWLASPGPRNCLVELNLPVALTVSLEGGWNVITSKENFTSTALYTEATAKIVPAYLLYLCRKRLALPKAESLAESVLLDLGTWFAEQGGDKHVVHCAYDVWRPGRDQGRSAYTSACERFGELLGLLYEDGLLSFHPGRKVGKESLLSRLDGGVFLPKTAFYTALTAKRCPLVDGSVIFTILSEAGVLIGEDTLAGSAGWIVRTDWWEKQQRAWQAGRRTNLRIVG